MRAPAAPAWWRAPDRLGPEAVTVLACLAALAAVTGYLGTLLTQTITFAAQEFHADKATQGVALGAARVDVVLSLVLVAAADRHGRRVVAVWSAAAGCSLTALGALAPSLPWLVASQILARGFVTAVAIVIGVMAAEAMPAGSRAYAAGLLAMAAAVGSGVCVVALPVADTGVAGWRILFAAALVGTPLVIGVGRMLPESRRYQLMAAARAGGGGGDDGRQVRGPRTRRAWRSRQSPAFRRRLVLLAGASLLFNVFVIPASQFQNEYLRHERHFPATRVSLFTIVTVLPGAVGIVLGGRLADTQGRRRVGAVSLVGGVTATVIAYVASGWAMWVCAAFASLVGTAVIPALGVYGPELFSTDARGAANGLITAAGRVGSVIGLVGVGLLSSTLGHFGPAFALVAVGPAMLVVLVLVAFPETAKRELEDINPEDQHAALP
jgi:MFS family permease